MNVIIVEDDPMVAQLNEQYLSQVDGVRVAARFANGRDALEYLKASPVELAVMDVYMPMMNGLELLRAIRGAGIQTAVIMITAATEMPVVEDALRLGIEDYIIKPFPMKRLQEAVRKYMSKAQLAKSRDTADQAVVDQLLHSSFSADSATHELRKGLNAKTLGAIEALIRENPDGPHTCESISAESGLSKVTVRHYLNYLIETGTLRSSIDYETGGRPRVLYRLK
ncbi:MAG: response regulator [Oscillospiraceae bacterium]|nr:response regulator [Oscillospiraceae bacterium]